MNRLYGKRVVITGKLSVMRKEAVYGLENLGAIVQPQITSMTDYLVVGDRPGSKKLRDADWNGVRVIKEADLNNMALG